MEHNSTKKEVENVASMEIPVTIDTQGLAKHLMESIASDRKCRMVFMYGEACTKAEAAKAISCSAQTITAMLEDGRIRSACEGTKVDVASLVDYIERRKDADRAARMTKRGRGAWV